MAVPIECGPSKRIPIGADAQIRKWIAELSRHCQSLKATWRQEIAEEAGAVGYCIGQRPDNHGVANNRWLIGRPDSGQRISCRSLHFHAIVRRILAFAAIARINEPNAEPKWGLPTRDFIPSLTTNERSE